jgi:hypothetical protein
LLTYPDGRPFLFSVHPLVTSFDPPLKFQPLIKSMAGTPKEQAEKIATISHALRECHFLHCV